MYHLLFCTALTVLLCCDGSQWTQQFEDKNYWDDRYEGQKSSLGERQCSIITKAIKDFPTPSGRTDLRSFFGLVNQLSGSTNAIAQALAPLRPVLQVKNDYLWNALHEDAFNKAKEILTTAPILAFYDQSRPTRLTTDACRHSLGFVLQQEHKGSWHIVQAGSRFLTDTETRYAVIELEMLSVAWAAQKCRIFLARLPTFTVITDHSPLVPILNSHRLDEIENPRLQRLRTRLLAYNFIAKWIKGKDNDAADALSRYPCSSPKAKTTMLPTHSLATHARVQNQERILQNMISTSAILYTPSNVSQPQRFASSMIQETIFDSENFETTPNVIKSTRACSHLSPKGSRTRSVICHPT